MRTLRLLATVGITILTVPAAAHAQARPARVFVLDQWAPSVTALDLSGTVLRTAPLQGSPSILLRTPDSKLLVVLDRGTGKDAGDAGFQAKTKSSATILDAGTLATRARVELGAGLETTAMLSAAGDRLAVICPGYVGKQPGENQPRELVTVDLAGGRIAGRVPLGRPASAFFATPDGATAVVLSHRDTPRQTPQLGAELQLIDLKTATSLATLALEGDPRNPVLAPDGKFVYLLDKGKPNGNPEKNVNGRVHVVSLASRKVETVHEVGSGPRGFVLDEAGGQLLLVSNRPPVKGEKEHAGELRAFRGASVVGPMATLAYPELVRSTADGKRLFVVSGSGVITFGTRDLAKLSEWRDKGLATATFDITPDGRRAFCVWQQNLYTYDNEKGGLIDKHVTGSSMSRLAAALDASAKTESSKAEGIRQARAKGKSHYNYTEYTVRDADQSLAIRPDSKAVYVINRQTSDVTVADAETGRIIEKVGADGFAVDFMPAAGVALVTDTTAVHALDLETHTVLQNWSSKEYNFDRPEISTDGKAAVINGNSAVLLISGGSGKPVGKLAPFKRVADLEVDWGRTGR
jgi:DNA-binding beta-propeller fold protein YncE